MPAVVEATDFTVAAALRKFAPGYIAKYQARMPPHHRKVLGLITRCKTGELGNVMYRCRSCMSQHWVGRSCGNRHCPNCQKEKTQAWLAKQTAKLLPVQHFVVTFTVPQELRSLLRDNPEAGYEAIFAAGSETIRTLLKNPKNLGSDKVGFFGVLHTWGRDLTAYHPHVHFVVPGGGVSPDVTKWMQVKPDRLFHPLPAKKLYKKLFVEALRKAGLYDQLPAGVLKFDWVVNIKPVGDGGAVLKYLAPYVYRVAICDNRITAVDDSGVFYKVKPSGKRQYKTRHLDGESFVRSFAQHILPPGFRKVRYYGFMSSNCKLQLADARWLVWLWLGWTYWLSNPKTPPEVTRHQPPKCARCGGELELQGITGSDGQWIWHIRLA
ncbi:transposase, partial [Stieleria sp. TO1_6]|uniref:IS91 family transposase n=1 Tax=Stieleria tagensis TaxID=2956795 RepID=UPI00209A6445